jgi:hypothetical protein
MACGFWIYVCYDAPKPYYYQQYDKTYKNYDGDLFMEEGSDQVFKVEGEPVTKIKWGPPITFDDHLPNHYPDFYKD